MKPLLESIAQTINYDDLPEIWHIPNVARFSHTKTLYDYQQDALKKAARALFLYYGKDEQKWHLDEKPSAQEYRKKRLAQLYPSEEIAELTPGLANFDTPEYDDRRRGKRNPVFPLLAPAFLSGKDDTVPYWMLCARMCFWMATGSGKTLVMVKLMEYLFRLQKRRQIPSHDILILAPSEHLLQQIRSTVEDLNKAGGLQINLVSLRDFGKDDDGLAFGDTQRVYFYRSDNISDVEKEVLLDYRLRENDGKWFVFLDEAHKGTREDSKRKAYYARLAKNGFLFNFSATFTDEDDIITTVAKYNLEDFIRNGHGKKIHLSDATFGVFQRNKEIISSEDKRKIVLKSLITLAFAKLRVSQMREEAEGYELYHNPMMLTLVHSVNTAEPKNDLLAFFKVLQEIAGGVIDAEFFKAAKKELSYEWRDARGLFETDNSALIGNDEGSLTGMSVASLREAVFLGKRRGALEYTTGADNKEIAFKLKTAAAPFALIRVGNISAWTNDFLVGMEQGKTLHKGALFADLEKSDITILMGSRAFFESWDSNRPNVINFINIGTSADAKKFITQSVGRGVRIEPLPGHRKRMSHVLPALSPAERDAMDALHGFVAAPETLFVYATNSVAIKTVMERLKSDQGDTHGFRPLSGFIQTKRPIFNGKPMSLLVPFYQTVNTPSTRMSFGLSAETLDRFCLDMKNSSDSMMFVRDGLSLTQINKLRTIAAKKDIKIRSQNDYADIGFLRQRLCEHFEQITKKAGGVRDLDSDDIVHFKKIEVALSNDNFAALCEKITALSADPQEQKKILRKKRNKGEISEDEYDSQIAKISNADKFQELNIRYLANHYYVPLVIAEDYKSDYIRRILRVESEVKFLQKLENWLTDNTPKWDAWMFSKLDEITDSVNIPYYDKQNNSFRNFKPDFVFWMCRADKYRIFFVDPKSTTFTDAYGKADGYETLFANKRFSHRRIQDIEVKMAFFTEDKENAPGEKYRQYWIDTPEVIFA